MKKTKSRGEVDGSPAPMAGKSVAVVVTTYNHARFLDEALRSVAAQTRRPERVVVVDDGSADDPGAVVAGRRDVRLVRQANAGLAAARNRGLEEAAGCDYVVFLDADDALLPRALELGLACHARNPRCGFVYGGHRRTDAALYPLAPPVYRPLEGAAYHALLEGNFIGSCGTVMFDRAKLAESGGFDPAVRRCEDYDAYFRLARRYPVAGHSAVVADYRMHAANMSMDLVAMAEWATRVQARHRPRDGDAAALAAYRRGRRRWWRIYALGVWRERGGLAAKWAMTRRAPFASLLGAAAAALRLALPERAYRSLRQAIRRRLAPAGGAPARAEPFSRAFGYDRGTPIDRWYIESFLDREAGDIRGRVLEIGDDAYSRRFGTGIVRQDVLHVTPGAPGATLVGDISQAGTLPQGAFDCLVITQTLHLVYDMPAAVEHLRQSLAAGGVLLLTVPGVSSVDPGEWGATWYWSLTPSALTRLLGEAFGPENVSVEAFGNVYAATSFLYGLAVEDLDPALLAAADGAYPMVVCARARRVA